MNIDRPWMFLILIPALILGIIPFFRLQKKRRMSSKHLIPFIIHLVLIMLLSAVLAGVRITETTTAPTETKVVFVIDMSDSNAMMKDKMNTYITDIIASADLDDTKFGMVVFGGNESNGILKTVNIGDLDPEKTDYIDFEVEEGVNYAESNITSALEKAKSLFDLKERSNKRIVLLSDGRQTTGNAFITAQEIANDGIRLDASYFNIGSDGEKEVQIIGLSTSDEIEYGKDVSLEVTVRSSVYLSRATIVAYYSDGKTEADRTVITSAQGGIPVGVSTHSLTCKPESAGVNTIKIEIIPGEGDDIIAQNNEYYSWYRVDAIGKLLIVNGDGSQLDQIKDSSIDFDGYEMTEIKPEDFPKDLESLLEYDEVVLMNVNVLEDMPLSAPVIIKRFVEEVGRGLLVTAGDNVYDYDSDGYAESPINDLLPVELQVDEEKQTVAMILVIDLSSSMKETMGDQTRYRIVVDSAKKVLMENNFAENDYVGVVAFDQDYHTALEVQEIGDLENREKICKTLEYNLDHIYYSYYLNKEDKTESDIRINKDHFDGNNEYVDGDSAKYVLPEKYSQGGQDSVTGDYIKTYGTSYKWALQAASEMLSEASNITSIEVKQIIFMSDGAPNDQGSGYDGIVQRLARGGTVTSAIVIGTDDSDAISELEKIASDGKGELFKVNSAEELKDDLTEIVESIQGELFNTNITTTPKRLSLNSIVHVGTSNDGYDVIHGYYGTSIKDGAENVLYVDNLRPLYAEWEYGLGKVCVLMTDLGNYEWTGEWFDDNDGKANLQLLENILLSPLHNRVDSTGMQYSISRDEETATITIETYASLREVKTHTILDPFTYQEIIRATVSLVDENGELKQLDKTYTAKAVGSKKYTITFPTETSQQNYIVNLEMLRVEAEEVGNVIAYAPLETAPLCDYTQIAVVGKYHEEYDVLNSNGELTIGGIASNGGGTIVDEGGFETFYDNEIEETVIYEHDITTPAIIIALILFILDLVFRNFVIKIKKDKDTMMTDEEQIASMKGR